MHCFTKTDSLLDLNNKHSFFLHTARYDYGKYMYTQLSCYNWVIISKKEILYIYTGQLCPFGQCKGAVCTQGNATEHTTRA